ncbi:MAG: DNA mismatch repair endonuclease MutL [Clostridia bacterium]|nr:DNA mismatch repair endonuclease MutL [Clostridia bacterium]
MSIKVLSKDVINKISAGEVVEKPASVVKELIENSIDAGAKNITVEIENGGIDRISILDDGCGIKKEEISLAFTSHATSKLTQIDDLNSLQTMGFRGEALATISAVSKVTIITKTASEDLATMVKLVGSEQVEQTEVASNTGTKIDVNNIFFNTPERLKFLRKPKSEENDITNYVEKMILSNKDISFKYIVNGKLIYNTSSGELLNNIYTIYGREVADGVIPVDYQIGDYKIFGFISKPELSRANRTYQNLFVNNRYCINPLISTAVQNAYDNFMMKGKFPLYVLFVSLPQSELDVNVHPNKLEVKFADTHKVYQLTNDAVYKALYDFNQIRNVELSSNEEIINDEKTNNIVLNELSKNEGVSFDNGNSELNEEKLQELRKTMEKTQHNSGAYDFELTNNILTSVDLNTNTLVDDSITTNDNSNNQIIIENSETFKPKQEDYKDLFKTEYKMVGKVFNTYLILEQEDRLYLIDQHAAHERQKYDKLIEQLDKNMLTTQDLLIPYTFSASGAEYDFVLNNLDLLNSFGIDICEFGANSFKVSSVPLLLADINLKDYFDEMLKNIYGLSKSPKEIIREKFMQIACKSAVKGGDDLKDLEIKHLLNKLKQETEVLLCPHGRPIIVEIDKKQIEKWFKRIVN